jgi:hypothetical protein
MKNFKIKTGTNYELGKALEAAKHNFECIALANEKRLRIEDLEIQVQNASISPEDVLAIQAEKDNLRGEINELLSFE